jgi:hypothetical protein
LFALLSLLFVGPLAWVGGALARRVPLGASGRATERLRWRAVWFPALPPALAFAALAGWAVQEPADAERVHVGYAVLAAPTAFTWARALGRAGVALVRGRRAAGPAVTVGLFAPRVSIDPRFARTLDCDELVAVRAHEEAHARRCDPLRVWLAQIATDLQWPLPGAAARYVEWRAALELARDEEARLAGADGGALASAIVKALRMRAWAASPHAALVFRAEDVTERVRRNLTRRVPPDTDAPRAGVAPHAAFRVVLLAAAFGAGLLGGESVVTLLAGASA